MTESHGEHGLNGSLSFEQVRLVCETFVKESAQGERRPAIPDYIREVAADAQPTLLRNLLHFELARRRQAGEIPAVEDYLRELPEFGSIVRQVFCETTSLSQGFHTTDEFVAAPQPHAFLPAANLLGPYRLIRELGRGGMGAVFEAEHLQHGHRVALKTLPALDGARLHRFKREFRALANINHPNLVPVVGSGVRRADHRALGAGFRYPPPAGS